MKTAYIVLRAIVFGLLVGIATLVAAPLLIIYAAVKIIIGMASAVR